MWVIKHWLLAREGAWLAPGLRRIASTYKDAAKFRTWGLVVKLQNLLLENGGEYDIVPVYHYVPKTKGAA